MDILWFDKWLEHSQWHKVPVTIIYSMLYLLTLYIFIFTLFIQLLVYQLSESIFDMRNNVIYFQLSVILDLRYGSDGSCPAYTIKKKLHCLFLIILTFKYSQNSKSLNKILLCEFCVIFIQIIKKSPCIKKKKVCLLLIRSALGYLQLATYVGFYLCSYKKQGWEFSWDLWIPTVTNMHKLCLSHENMLKIILKGMYYFSLKWLNFRGFFHGLFSPLTTTKHINALMPSSFLIVNKSSMQICTK